MVDCQIPLGKNNSLMKPYYFALSNRGLKLRAYMIDDLDLGVFRGMLLWAEPFTQLWKCRRCEQLQYSSFETKPPISGCNNDKNHSWQAFKTSKPTTTVVRFEEAA